MGPPPLPLGLMVNEGLYRRLSAQAMVGQHGIISQQPVGEFPVKGGQVIEQQILVVVHEGLLDGAVEAFGVGIHFRGAGIGPPVRDAAFVEALLEMPLEFCAITREEEAGRALRRRRSRSMWATAAMHRNAKACC